MKAYAQILVESMPLRTGRGTLKGEPEDVVPKYVDEHAIDLVVMGTVARTGISGLVIGNTAERVLQRLRVSVLATKPPGFTSQVTL